MRLALVRGPTPDAVEVAQPPISQSLGIHGNVQGQLRHGAPPLEGSTIRTTTKINTTKRLCQQQLSDKLFFLLLFELAGIYNILFNMHIYLDESYNLQKQKGKLFISINGFAVLNDDELRKRWKNIRKPYARSKRRIHAADSSFEALRIKSFKLLNRHDVDILSVFQLVQEIPYNYFIHKYLDFDLVYLNLLKELFLKISFGKYSMMEITVDARKHKGGKLAEKQFQKEINTFLETQFPNTTCNYKTKPSYLDVLVELADFVSHAFYKEYQNNINKVFKNTSFKIIQIKNPL